MALGFLAGFAVPPSFAAPLSSSSAAVFVDFFAFFGCGFVVVSSAFDGPRLRTFEVGGGDAGAFWATAAVFLRGGMTWEWDVGGDVRLEAVGDVVVGRKTLTWHR